MQKPSFNSLFKTRMGDFHPEQRIQQELTFEFCSRPEEFDGKIRGTAKVLDIGRMPLNRSVNVRESFGFGPISESRMETLFTDGSNFLQKNLGITITASSAVKVNETTYRVKFTTADHGVPNGGGTLIDIQKAVAYDRRWNDEVLKAKNPDPEQLAEAKMVHRNLADALVPITIIIGATKAQISGICAGQNTSNKVSAESQMDQEGVFEDVKDAFEAYRKGLSDHVAWYQNRGREKGAKEMKLSVGTVIKLWLGVADLYTVDQSKSYSSLDYARRALRKRYQEEGFIKAANLVPFMYELYEEVCKAISTHKRSWTTLDRKLVLDSEAEYFLAGGSSKNTVTEPAAMPIVMALRQFIKPDYSGWERDPVEFLSDHGKDLIAKVFEDHDLLGGDATSFGKESRTFEDVFNAVAAILNKESRKRAA